MSSVFARKVQNIQTKLKGIHVLALNNISNNKNNKVTNVKIIFFTYNFS